MIGGLVVQNDEPVMENLRSLDRQCRVLCVKVGCIGIGQPCAGVSVNLYINACVLLCQNIQRIHIHITIDQNDFLLRFLDNGRDQVEGIVNLTVKENLLF